jgi:predicted dehydrogenase
MTSPLRVAVIGVGGIARTHMPGWQASPHAEVVAGADINPRVLQAWGAEYGVARLAERIEDVLHDPDIDIIDVCVPNMHHAPIAIAALEAGKHVICEKPLAPTPGEIRRMIAARDASGKLLMTAQHFRFAGVSQAMKHEINTGALGDIYHARSWMLRRNGLIPTPGFVHRSLSGGGPCIDIGVHVLDLTLWLMGHLKPVARRTGASPRRVLGLAVGADPHHLRCRGLRQRLRALREWGDAGDRGELAAAPRDRGRRHADLAVWPRGWGALAARRVPLEQQ